MKHIAMKNRISGPALSIMLPLPGEPAVPFPWRPVPEHLMNLLGIREPLTVGDLPLLQTGQLPHPLSQTHLRRAQCLISVPQQTISSYIETAEVVETIAPALCMQDMHTLMQQVCGVTQSKRQPCFNIWDGTPANMVNMLA